MKRIEKRKRKDKEKIDKFFESRQKKVNNFTYFAQPLESICEPGSYVPVFIDKCIDFVENAGKSRTRGNPNVHAGDSDCATPRPVTSRNHCNLHCAFWPAQTSASYPPASLTVKMSNNEQNKVVNILVLQTLQRMVLKNLLLKIHVITYETSS